MNGGAKDARRADHFQYLYEQASAGRCGASGLPLTACKASICDCFDFPWVRPDDGAADAYFTGHAFVDRSEYGYDCACGWSGTYSREVHLDTAAEQHRQHLTTVTASDGDA